MTRNVAVILCGSGFKDGSEIRESVGVLWALSKHSQLKVQCFALDAPQADVVDCLSGEKVPETRNQLVESARIARGQVKDLKELDPAEFSALVIPGGFGAAKNLCDFASKGIQGTVQPALKEKLNAFKQAAKPIGAVCIAPMILAMAFPQQKFEMTLGGSSQYSDALESLGHVHRICAPYETCVDSANKIVTTPAYMHDQASLADIFKGIDKLVTELIAL